MKKVLIFGVTGQDGSYLADLLLEKGYEVFGMIRRSATGNTKNIQHLLSNEDLMDRRFHIVRGDLADPTSIYRIISQVEPDEIYNEADQDHVSWSYDMVGYSSDITGSAVARILEIIKQVNPKIRYFQPCSSNMFGLTTESAQNEQTLFNPQSPYAVCKTFAYYMTRYYRETHGLFASTAILFNHESPRRTSEYVTRKITSSVARIKLGLQKELLLGDRSAKVDWGYAKEYMEAAWTMLQLDHADDFVIGTNEAHSVQEFVDEAFSVVGLNPQEYVKTDERFMRPSKTSTLVSNTSKAEKAFGFRPKVRFKELVKLMVEADLEMEEKSASCR